MGFGLFQMSKDEEQKSSSSKELKEKFLGIKEKEVEKAAGYRIVNLRLRVGCGCGGSTTPVHVVIPNDDSADGIIERINDMSYNDRIDDDDLRDILRDNPNVTLMANHYYGSDDAYNIKDYVHQSI